MSSNLGVLERTSFKIWQNTLMAPLGVGLGSVGRGGLEGVNVSIAQIVVASGTGSDIRD